jgi:hypothetical protein
MPQPPAKHRPEPIAKGVDASILTVQDIGIEQDWDPHANPNFFQFLEDGNDTTPSAAKCWAPRKHCRRCLMPPEEAGSGTASAAATPATQERTAAKDGSDPSTRHPRIFHHPFFCNADPSVIVIQAKPVFAETIICM